MMDILTFYDAKFLSEPLSLNLMMKPIGSVCNLRCKYCYYIDKISQYGKSNPIMSLESLEICIEKFLEINETNEITFNWHGGEPLLLGLDYFEKIIEFQNKYRGNINVHNTLQTNATLLTPDFARFFKDNAFLLGVSIDGPMDIHDRYRSDNNGKSSFYDVMKGIALLHRFNVDFNTMTTINKASEGRGADVYLFLKQIGSHYMQFMPVCEYDANSIPTDYSVDPLAYGQFMCDIYDIWKKYDIGRYFVNLFDSTLANYCSMPNGLCSYSELCANNVVVEFNGDLYPCDHFVFPKYKIGNVFKDPLKQIFRSQKLMDFRINKRNSLPQKCFACRYFKTCYGGCPKHRSTASYLNNTSHYSLCEGIFLFNSYVENDMLQMRNDICYTNS